MWMFNSRKKNPMDRKKPTTAVEITTKGLPIDQINRKNKQCCGEKLTVHPRNYVGYPFLATRALKIGQQNNFLDLHNKEA